MKLDPKLQLEGALYSRSAALEMAQRHAEAIQKLANVKLEVQCRRPRRRAPAMRSTPQFDLVLDVPEVAGGARSANAWRRKREQLEKNIANSERQLGDEAFLGKAPANVVESIRAKLADYKAQLRKIKRARRLA